MAKRIRVEIDRLGSTDIGLGSFNPKTTIHELDIPHIHDRIQKAAPALCKLLFALLEPKHPSKTSLRLIKIWLLSSPLLLHLPMHPTHMILFRCFWHIFIQWASNVEAWVSWLVLVLYRPIEILCGKGMRKRAALAEIGKVIPFSWDIVSFMIAN